MDLIKEAFSKIKEDINSLRIELNELKDQIKLINNSKSNHSIPTNVSQKPLLKSNISDRQTIKTGLEELYSAKTLSSIGNEGVQTNNQTNNQTIRQLENGSNIDISEFRKAREILESLDNIKKDIRDKFKSLTPQEMLIFNTIYSLDNQNVVEITYKILAKTLKLSESSIRDYVNKLLQKKIPIDKIRQNNKTIILKIAPDLKEIATLESIISLREL